MNKALRTKPDTLHRLRTWLRERYPQHTTKLVARDIEADPRTVENWLASDPQPPIWRHWEAMMAVYGPLFVAAVFAPPEDYERRRALHARLDALEAQVKAVREAV